jgi:hypothetical protein
MKFSKWLELRENNNRTGCKVGLYPPAYTLSQYPDAYYLPIAADYITYHDIEKKNPTITTPRQKLSFTVVSQGSDGKISRWTESP